MSVSLAQPPVSAPVDHVRRVEELGRIIMAYSEVTERLQQSHDQLTRQVEILRNELGEKNRLLERRNRLAALGEMAAGIAHEIRNPLGGIQLYASLLSRDVADRPEALTLVQKISGGVRRLDGLVGQVLQFSREMRVAPVPVDLAEIVEQAVELSAPQSQSAGVRCELDGDRPFEVMVDPLLFGQAVLNLLLNAIQATPSGGVVTIQWARGGTGGQAFGLTVRDTGPGIDPSLLDRIFNPFFTTRETGTGLGLAIVHRIIEAHDGTISAANASGGGAVFEIRL